MAEDRAIESCKVLIPLRERHDVLFMDAGQKPRSQDGVFVATTGAFAQFEMATASIREKAGVTGTVVNFPFALWLIHWNFIEPIPLPVKSPSPARRLRISPLPGYKSGVDDLAIERQLAVSGADLGAAGSIRSELA